MVTKTKECAICVAVVKEDGEVGNCIYCTYCTHNHCAITGQFRYLHLFSIHDNTLLCLHSSSYGALNTKYTHVRSRVCITVGLLWIFHFTTEETGSLSGDGWNEKASNFSLHVSSDSICCVLLVMSDGHDISIMTNAKILKVQFTHFKICIPSP